MGNSYHAILAQGPLIFPSMKDIIYMFTPAYENDKGMIGLSHGMESADRILCFFPIMVSSLKQNIFGVL